MNIVRESSRKIMFDNGQSLTLENIVGYSSNDTTLGIHLENGELIIVNPKRVLYHKIKPIGETTK